MKIGKSEKKHFCDKSLAALKGGTERDHQVVGEAKRACKNCRYYFQKDHNHSGEVRSPEGEGQSSRVLRGSWRSLGLDQVDRHWGNALQDSLTGRHRWPREAGDTSLHRAEHLPSGVGWHVEAVSLAQLDCSHRAQTV